MTRTCIKCHKEFTAYRADIKNCSQECRSYLTSANCKGCNELYKPRTSRQKYCSHGCYAKTLLGATPWNKGMSGFLGGESHYNWKGGRGTERHAAMIRLSYRTWRDAVFARDNYTCQICYDYGGHLHADHIKPWADHPDSRYDIDNGRSLCRFCHYYITFKRKMPVGSKWGLTSARKRG